MGERLTLTRQANDGAAMTVREVAELGQAWMLARVPGDVVPVARVDGTGLWSLTVTYDPEAQQVVDGLCTCGHEPWEHHFPAPRECFARVRGSQDIGPHDHHECPCTQYEEAPRG